MAWTILEPIRSAVVISEQVVGRKSDDVCVHACVRVCARARVCACDVLDCMSACVCVFVCALACVSDYAGLHVYIRALVRVSVCVHVRVFFLVCVRERMRACCERRAKQRAPLSPALLPFPPPPAFPVRPFIVASIQPLDLWGLSPFVLSSSL
jgi:hypothetical protein